MQMVRCKAMRRKQLFDHEIENLYMLIINVKDGENIDRALKRYKRKHRKVGVLKEIRRRKHYTKPSDERRDEILKAAYKKQKEEEEA